MLIAHAADWISLAFFVPVIGFLVWLLVTQRRHRDDDEPELGGDPEA